MQSRSVDLNVYMNVKTVCCFALKGSVQQLLDKKNEMNNQDEVCTVLGELS